jgi:AraC family transcriptional regulator
MVNRLELTALFTGVGNGLITLAAGATLGPRRRDHYELLWIQSGSGVFKLDGRETRAEEGVAVFAPPARVEFVRWDKHRPTRVAFFQFTFKQLPADWPDVATWPRRRKLETRNVMTSLFELIQTHAPMYPTTTTIDPTLERAVETLLAAYLVGPAALAPPMPMALPEPVDHALEWIKDMMEADPAFPASLSDLAQASGVSPKHLCRLFRSSLGCGPMQAVWVYRVTHSLLFLREPRGKISEIAEHLGFASAFHYSHRFRKFFGEPPSEMRKKLQAGYRPRLPDWPYM